MLNASMVRCLIFPMDPRASNIYQGATCRFAVNRSISVTSDAWVCVKRPVMRKRDRAVRVPRACHSDSGTSPMPTLTRATLARCGQAATAGRLPSVRLALERWSSLSRGRPARGERDARRSWNSIINIWISNYNKWILNG